MKKGIILLLITVALINSVQSTPHKRPNVLWVIAEDMTATDLGCYGNSEVYTPNIDKFSKEAVRFTNCFSTGAVCSASRSAIISGMYQTAIGAQNHRTPDEYKPELPVGTKLLPEIFHENSYYSVLCRPKHEKELRKVPGPYGTGKTDFNFVFDEKSIFDGYDWHQREKGQPFFGYLTLLATHRGEWWNDIKEVTNPEEVTVPRQYPDNKTSRQDIAMYYNAVAEIDRNFGDLLQQLKDEGLYDNTIIIFSADHGRPMPRGKQFCYDEGVHVPLIVSDPGHFLKMGTISDQIVSLMDVSATVLDMCGIEVPDNFHAVSILNKKSKQRKYAISARDRCDETVMRIRSVRDKRFRYIRNFDEQIPYTAANRYKDNRYPIMIEMRKMHETGKLTEVQELFFAEPRPSEELYDCWNDPNNLNNLADDPKFKRTLRKMRKRLNNWIVTYSDKGTMKESNELMDKIMEERVKKYGY